MVAGVGSVAFSWIQSPQAVMVPHVTRAIAQLIPAVTAAMEAAAARVRAEAQANAPWNDITGNARAGLSTDVSAGGVLIVLTLYHTVAYGIWLEIRWGGKYAIINRTLQENYAPIMAAVTAALGTIW